MAKPLTKSKSKPVNLTALDKQTRSAKKYTARKEGGSDSAPKLNRSPKPAAKASRIQKERAAKRTQSKGIQTQRAAKRTQSKRIQTQRAAKRTQRQRAAKK